MVYSVGGFMSAVNTIKAGTKPWTLNGLRDDALQATQSSLNLSALYLWRPVGVGMMNICVNVIKFKTL